MRIAFILDGVVRAIYIEESPPDYLYDARFEVISDPAVAVGWVKIGETFSEPEVQSTPVIASFGRIITVLAYRLRFLTSERITLKIVASSGTPEAAAVAVSMEDTMAAGYINLDHPATASGTSALEAAGLISVGRSAEILSPPVYSGELPASIRISYGLSEVPSNSELTYNSGKGYSAAEYTAILQGL